MCFFRVSMQIDQNSKLQANISASQDLSSLGPRVWAEPKLINISKKFPIFFSILIWVRYTRCFDVIPNLERWVSRPDATIHKTDVWCFASKSEDKTRWRKWFLLPGFQFLPTPQFFPWKWGSGSSWFGKENPWFMSLKHGHVKNIQK